MKDVSDTIIGRTSDVENKTFPGLDIICLEEKPIVTPAVHCEECDTNRALPELSNTWGDFEGFDEFTPQSEQFYYADDVLQLNTVTNSSSNGGHRTEQTDGQDRWDAFNGDDDEHSQDYEQIFRRSFPSPPVEEMSEEVKSLEILLASTSDEDFVSHSLKSCLWLDCDWTEKAGNILTNPGCDWNNSKGCQDLMSLLCISTENTSVNGDKSSEVLTSPDLEQSHVEDALYPKPKKSLIQTKLEVAPGSKQGHIISYQQFLKKPSDVPISFFNFSGRKRFFSTNQMRFNF